MLLIFLSCSNAVLGTPISASPVETDLSQFRDNNTVALSQFLPEDFRKLVKNEISKIFSNLLSNIDERYSNEQLGLQIEFPDAWKGTLIKPANSLIITPSEINVTQYMVNTTEKGFYSVIYSMGQLNNTTSPQEIFQTTMNSIMSEVFGSLEQLQPTITVTALSKDGVKSFQNHTEINPPTESLASIWYDYTLSAMKQMVGSVTQSDQLGTNKIISINSTETNGIPVEISVSEITLPESVKPHRTLGYLFLTKDNIIGIEYSAGLDNYEKYIPKFENSISTVKIMNSVPISEENIKQFLN